jgi:hypothetical protein
LLLLLIIYILSVGDAGVTLRRGIERDMKIQGKGDIAVPVQFQTIGVEKIKDIS